MYELGLFCSLCAKKGDFVKKGLYLLTYSLKCEENIYLIIELFF